VKYADSTVSEEIIAALRNRPKSPALSEKSCRKMAAYVAVIEPFPTHPEKISRPDGAI